MRIGYFWLGQSRCLIPRANKDREMAGGLATFMFGERLLVYYRDMLMNWKQGTTCNDWIKILLLFEKVMEPGSVLMIGEYIRRSNPNGFSGHQWSLTKTTQFTRREERIK